MKKFLRYQYLIIVCFLFSSLDFLKSENYISELNYNNQLQTLNADNQSTIFEYKEDYILGAGDGIKIFFYGLPEFSGEVFIGPDGLISLPEIGQVYADGYTLKELESIVTKKYDLYVKNPKILTKIIAYRPVRVFVSGEVSKPGIYTLSGGSALVPQQNSFDFNNKNQVEIQIDKISPSIGKTTIFPSLFDALKASFGITPYSDISDITVIRKNTISKGGGKIKADINFLALFTENDQSQNIRLFDGDIVKVSKSEKSVSEQLLQVRNSNLNPEFVNVYVSGNVPSPGLKRVPRGSGIVQAVALAGGPNLFSGKVNFLRFLDDGNLEKRKIKFNPKSKINSYKNPILLNNDVIHIDKSVLGKTTALLREVSTPVFTSYSLYNLFND